MRSLVTTGKVVAAVLFTALLVTVFLVGAQRGYELGYAEGEKRANGWWIDKKSRYYESAEIKKKRIHLKYNQV